MRDRRPTFIFLIETFCLSSKISKIKTCLDYDDFVAVDCIGYNGGLALLWRSVSHISVLNLFSHCIDVEISIDGIGSWRLTGFYGQPNHLRRNETWNLLRNLRDCSPLPWVCLGDFNDLLAIHEKRGGRPQPRAFIQGFREAICDAGLTDFPMGGYPFTWEHGKDSDHWIEEKLDRVLVSNGWRYKFLYAQAYTLDITTFDHLPIFLDVRSMVTRDHVRRFKFENY
ncbi:hypothetical protein MANES_13G023901v8 [Manihot esculenta]|uniref:Uncharacterized protein n=1 Tax=Manihot esculenta TaxID=3983 RepID=A0ACB7GK25_MANES|nr:hypothetical protein MANES_13G023901v8 [Manihot esculenta]